MEIKETLDNSVPFGALDSPGQVFFDPKNSKYYMITDKRDGWAGGVFCVNLIEGNLVPFCSNQKVIPCKDIELSLRR